LRAAEPLAVKPIPIGTATALTEKTPVVVAASGGPEAVLPAVVVSRRDFVGYWEYLLDDAIFTAPPHPAWSGAALLGPDGKLAGIGSLVVSDAKADLPGNMFVPIDRLQPVMGDLLALGRPSAPSRPWLGVNLRELDGKLVVGRVGRPERQGGRPPRRSGDCDRRGSGSRTRRFLSHAVAARRRRGHGEARRGPAGRGARDRGQHDRPVPLPQARHHVLTAPREMVRT